MNQLVWYRTDLRVQDHAALCTAVENANRNNGKVYALYFWSEAQLRSHGAGSPKTAAILTAITSLTDELRDLNIEFRVINTPNWTDIPPALLEFIRHQQIADLHFHIEPGYNEFKRDRQSIALLQPNIRCHRYHDLFLIPPETHLNKQATPYKVFTAFKKSTLSQSNQWLQPPLPRPEPLNAQKPKKTSISQAKETWSNSLDLPITETEAHQQLSHFLPLTNQYTKTRDFPAIEGTSRLSVALANGTLTSRQIAWVIHSNGHSLYESTYFSEILWREFFKYVVFHHPELCMGKAFNQKNDRFPWLEDERRLTAWQNGDTGVPIVDSAMQQLNQTGWMHNRLRMICAMYLSKLLQLNWRLGEAYFADRLADFDFCANNGGWQWSASTGVDAVPYFRIFNPYHQSKKFDPEGRFIKSYLPSLTALNARQIHCPDTQTLPDTEYAIPIVDYTTSRKDTLEKFKSLK